MRYFTALFSMALVACNFMTNAVAQEDGPDQLPFDVLPAVDQTELRQLAALPDAALIERIFGRAGSGQAPGLQKFFLPGTQIFPLSHGFSGPQEACIRGRSPVACRLYVQDLLTVQTAKHPQGVTANPFIGAAR